MILDTREAPPWHRSLSLGLIVALTPKYRLVLPSTGGSPSEEQEQGQRTARRRRLGGMSPALLRCGTPMGGTGGIRREPSTALQVNVLLSRLFLLLWSTNIGLNVFILVIVSSLS